MLPSCAIASGPITGTLLGSIFFPPSLQVFPYNDEIPRSLPPAEQSHISQPFQVLQTLRHVCSPSLYSLQYVHVSLVMGSPELGTALQLWPHSAECRGGSLPFRCWQCFHAAWNTIGHLCHKGTLLAHVHLGVHQDP